MVMAMWYVLRTGVPWRDLPKRFGPWSSVYTRFRRWCRCGLWARLFRRLRSHAWGQIRSLDCSHVKVHADGSNPAGGQEGQAMGRTKGGLNSKVAATVDALGRPVQLAVAPGPQHDLLACAPLLPSLRDCWLLADRGFDADDFRQRLDAQGVRTCIPPRSGRRWPSRFSRRLYRQRHTVENFFARIKRYRRIATRYEKLADHFLGFLLFAAVLDWLKFGV
jgi:transposase